MYLMCIIEVIDVFYFFKLKKKHKKTKKILLLLVFPLNYYSAIKVRKT